MKQRVITALVLLLVLALVVWQINTPLLLAVVAFLSGVAANEIMRCAKVSNKFILIFLFECFFELLSGPICLLFSILAYY